MACLTYCTTRCIGSLASFYRQALGCRKPRSLTHRHHHTPHRSAHLQHHHLHHHHHHQWKQIAFLIITFAVYVSGIRNTASSSQQFPNGLVGDFNHQQPLSPSYQPMMPSNYEFQRPITPPSAPPPSAPPYFTTIPAQSELQQQPQQQQEQPIFQASPNKELQQKEFRPSEQIYDFTLSDATPVTPNYPPSYLSNTNSNNNAVITNHEMATKRYHREEAEEAIENTNRQFAFPTEISSNNIFGHQPTIYTTLPPPAQLQTTPILTYKDPYTNEKYQAALRRPTPATPVANDDDTNLIYYGNHQYQGDVAAQSAYTVQSSLLVGNSNGNANRGDSYRPLSSPNNEYKRPGYVFDEQIRPNYISNNRKPMQQPQRLSYDSHDYPPPSYYQSPQQQQQQQQQQQSTYFQSPQRQDIGIQPISQASTHSINYQPAVASIPPPYASPSSSSSASNYANNFGNYLLADAQHQYQQQQHQQPQRYPPHQYPTQENYYPHQHHQQQQQQQRPPSNYYAYQLGEIPPPQQRPPRPGRPTAPPPPYNHPNYVDQRPPPPQTSGLASLASLFTTTQQYAPQFTNLLLGAFTGGGGGGSAASSLRPQQQRPLNMQLIKALENIARNDDLQCVPKVLCQTIAGQTQRGQLPSFITSPAITNFLAGFPAASPALIYGRAALLGISGGERSCAQTYEQCPKNEYEILYYLNNHRGGFFKFFSEPEEQATAAAGSNGNGNYDDSGFGGSGGGGGGGVSSSLFSILTALTGNPTPPKPKTTTTTTTQRPATTLDIAGGIGNFFTQVLSDYLSGVEHQRRRRRRSAQTEIELDNVDESGKILNDEDFHDDEDNEDTDGDEETLTDDVDEQFGDVEARILHKDETPADYPKFFPDDDKEQDRSVVQVKLFNKQNAVRKLKFPSTQVDDRDPGKLGISWVSFEDAPADDQNFGASAFKSKRRGKKFNGSAANTAADNEEGQRIIFPDHYEQHIRKGRILNRPSYAAHYGDYVRATPSNDEGFVLANNQRRPHYQAFEQANGLSGQLGYYTTSTATSSHYSSVSGSYSSSTSGGGGGLKESGFRPTPLPATASNSFDQRYTSGNRNGYKGYRGSSYSSSGSNSNSASLYSQSHQHQNNYNYPNNNYVSNNRYSSNYQRPTAAATTTRRPRHEDDPNVYVNNGNGITEYYITPDGRKIYL